MVGGRGGVGLVMFDVLGLERWAPSRFFRPSVLRASACRYYCSLGLPNDIVHDVEAFASNRSDASAI